MTEKIGQYIAKTISLVLQPFLMPFYSVSLLFLYTNFHFLFFDQALRLLLPVLVFSFLLPALFAYVLWKLKYIDSLKLSTQQGRPYLYFIFFISNLCSVYIFYSSGIYLWFVGLVLGFSLIAIIGFFINFYWKISAHMLGIGGLVGSVLSVCLYVKGLNPFVLFILLFLMASSLAISRLYLQRSTPAQVYVGFCLGFIIVYVSILLGAVWVFI